MHAVWLYTGQAAGVEASRSSSEEVKEEAVAELAGEDVDRGNNGQRGRFVGTRRQVNHVD